MSHKEHQLKRLESFVHRTFNGEDFKYFIKALKHIYTNHNGLESILLNTKLLIHYNQQFMS